MQLLAQRAAAAVRYRCHLGGNILSALLVLLSSDCIDDTSKERLRPIRRTAMARFQTRCVRTSAAAETR